MNTNSRITRLSVALLLLLGLTDTTSGHRLNVRGEEDPDEIELNATAMKNQADVNVYAKTFLSEGKNIQKIN